MVTGTASGVASEEARMEAISELAGSRCGIDTSLSSSSSSSSSLAAASAPCARRWEEGRLSPTEPVMKLSAGDDDDSAEVKLVPLFAPLFGRRLLLEGSGAPLWAAAGWEKEEEDEDEAEGLITEAERLRERAGAEPEKVVEPAAGLLDLRSLSSFASNFLSSFLARLCTGFWGGLKSMALLNVRRT